MESEHEPLGRARKQNPGESLVGCWKIKMVEEKMRERWEDHEQHKPRRTNNLSTETGAKVVMVLCLS